MSVPSNPPEGALQIKNSDEDDEDQVNLLDAAIVLARHKKVVFGVPVLAGILAAGLSLMQPNIFTASARIIPPQQGGTSSATAILSQLGGVLGGAAGAVRGPNDLYIGMLKSRTVADNLIQRFDLMKPGAYPSQVRAGLEGVTNIIAGKEGIVTIEVDDRDPARAAEIANAYVDELLKLTRVLAVTEASQRRLFFERQFELARDNLSKAEVALRQAMEKGGLVQVEGQGRAFIEMSARLRGQISAKEVQISGMRTFAADRNPELMAAQNELAALKVELSKMEGVTESAVDKSRDKSDRGIDNLRLYRDVKYFEAIYELLAKQFELAKIDEARDSAVVQVLDKAIPPDRKSKPRRTVSVLLTVAATFFAALLWAFLAEAWARARLDPKHVARLQTLRGLIAKR